MREISTDEFETPFRLTLEKAHKAIAGKYFHYARSLLQSLLDHYPNCPALRLMLRQTVIVLHEHKTSPLMARLQTLVTNVLYFFGHAPLKHLNSLEKILSRAPDCLYAHRSFAKEAMDKELWGNAALSLESISTLDPKASHERVLLAHCYLKLGRVEESQGIIRTVLEKTPKDDFAEELMKQASVMQTLNQEEWRR